MDFIVEKMNIGQELSSNIVTVEEYNEYRKLLHEKDEAVSKVSFEYTESALKRLNEIIEKLIDFRSKHAMI